MNYTEDQLETALTATVNTIGRAKIDLDPECPDFWLGQEKTALQAILDNLPKQECDPGEKIRRNPDEHPDPVNSPAHYTAHPSGVECIEITRHMNFNLGNAVKYLWRAGLKDDAAQDLQKAAFYIQDEINKIEGEK